MRPFLDRRAAGRQLGEALAGGAVGTQPAVVLAIPRGGVAVAAEVGSFHEWLTVRTGCNTRAISQLATEVTYRNAPARTAAQRNGRRAFMVGFSVMTRRRPGSAAECFPWTRMYL